MRGTWNLLILVLSLSLPLDSPLVQEAEALSRSDMSPPHLTPARSGAEKVLSPLRDAYPVFTRRAHSAYLPMNHTVKGTGWSFFPYILVSIYLRVSQTPKAFLPLS